MYSWLVSNDSMDSLFFVLIDIYFKDLWPCPCVFFFFLLQRMKATYAVTVDNIECAFFDEVEKLRDFGARNNENISKLLWGFFHYWAYCHDYPNHVISVRHGYILRWDEYRVLFSGSYKMDFSVNNLWWTMVAASNLSLLYKPYLVDFFLVYSVQLLTCQGETPY